MPLSSRKSGECYEDDDCAMFACSLCYEDRVRHLRFGPRSYSLEQADFIRRTVAERSPLPEPPLPVEESP